LGDNRREKEEWKTWTEMEDGEKYLWEMKARRW
jgi:hypothetical protein